MNRNLDRLLRSIRRGTCRAWARDASELPVFSRAAPQTTRGVWSWDADRLLIGTCADDLQIVARTEAEAVEDAA